MVAEVAAAAVRVAALGVEAPVAVAVLNGEPGSQLLLGCHGVEWLTGRRQVPLQYTLTAAVTAAGLPIIVTDATADRRVQPGPGARDAEVAAFAGFPIRDSTDETIGALCVIDRQPRTWSPQQLAVIDQAAQIISVSVAGCRLLPEPGGGADGGRDAAFLAALLDSLDTGVAACDSDGRLVLFNRALRDMLGAEHGMTLAEDWASRFQVNDPDGQPIPAEAMPLSRALQGVHARGVEQLIGPRQRHVLVNGHPIVAADGTRLGAVAAVHDITLRRRAERLTETELQICYALADAEDIATAGTAVLRIVGTTFGWTCGQVWLADDAGEGLRCTATWQAPGHHCDTPPPVILGRGDGPAGLAWKSSTAVWIPDTSRQPDQPDLADDDPCHCAQPVKAVLALPIRDADRTVGVLALFTDTPQDPDDSPVPLLGGLTAHLGQFLHRRHAADLQQQLDASKDEYIALIGHELRTPVTAIASYVELLATDPVFDGPDHAEHRAMLGIIERHTTGLRRAIDDLLDLAALDAGHLPMQPGTVDLVQLVRDTCTAVQHRTPEHRIILDPAAPARMPLNGDGRRLTQLLEHLLRNAVAYSAPGSRVDVGIAIRSDSAVITVADEGIGIPDDELDAVFRRFYRAGNVRHHGIPGTGLGLAVSRTIAEQHHGRIHLTSRNPGGTIATLTLPIPAAPAPHTDRAPA